MNKYTKGNTKYSNIFVQVESLGKSEFIPGYAFDSCSKLLNITIPSTIITIGVYAFYNCSSLESISIPDSVTSIGNYAFYGCSRPDIIFDGTMAQWAAITKGTQDNVIATVICSDGTVTL